MTESKFEEVSLLVDDVEDIDQQSLLDTIKDRQMSDTWHRYHLIGDVLRGDAPAVLDFDLTDKISQAIAEEPTVLAPKTLTTGQRVKAVVYKLGKPFGQVAIAASAAVLMIVGVQQNSPETEQLMPNQVVQTMPFGGVATPVSYDVPQHNQLTEKQLFLEQQQRFQALLADHQQQLKIKKIALNEAAAKQTAEPLSSETLTPENINQ